MNEDKATRYHRWRRRAQVASIATVGGVLIALATGGPLLRDLAQAAAAAAGNGPWSRTVETAVATALLALVLEAAALPWAYCLGFVLERRYELSRQSRAEWVRDHLKASSLATVMAIAAGVLVYAVIDRWPVWWWLVAGAGLALLATLLAFLAPVVLFPLFYRFNRLLAGELPDRLGRLAVRAGVPVLGVYEWSLGDKSRSANAALVGIGPTRRILLSDTLLNRYTTDEIEVIIAHELAHHVHGDIWKGVMIEAIQGTAALFVAHLALMVLGPRLGIASLADVAGLPLLAAVVAVWSLLTSPLLLAQSRLHERRADRYALEMTENSDAFVSAMRRLATQNLADAEPTRIVRWLFHSHPALNERIDFARHWAAAHLPSALPR